MTATPTNERVKAHRLRQKKAGLVEVRVWVPKGKEAEIRALAERLNAETSDNTGKKDD